MALLKTQWIHSDQIAILRGNTVVAAPVGRHLERNRYIETNGNRKTEGVFGMINNVANGCFRSCTRFENCETPCYEKCYGNCSIYAMKNKCNGFDICSNGMENNFFHLNLPNNDNYKLNTLKFWRIGSESSDLSLALALDLVEPWVKTNPDKFFTGISSNYFFVEAKKLQKISKYPNFWVGHTISVWFSDEELENRFTQIERYRDYGVRPCVWVVTNKDWISDRKGYSKEQKIIKKALKLVSPEQIIEIPFHANGKHQNAYLNINPHGSCCDTNEKKCKGCKILCGAKYIIKENNNER